MEFENTGKPIVIKRVKKVVGGHHGGAWKVAFADFATAMMAFFLLLWLLEAATPKQLKAVSGYFSDPSAFTEGGSPYAVDLGGGLKDDEYSGDSPEETPESTPVSKGMKADEQTIEDMAREIEARKMQELKRTLDARIEENPALEKFKDQIIMEVTRDGLQIQIVDKESRPMFDSGSDVIKPYMNDILMALAETIGTVPNHLSLSGHTDAQQFVDSPDYSNWELSADRANSARRSLLQGGVKEDQLAQVVGLSSSVLFKKDDPNNPINRRISILVMNQESQKDLKEMQEGGTPPSERATLPEDPDFKAPEIEQPEAGVEAPEPVKGDVTVTNDGDKQKLQQQEAFEKLRQTMTRRQNGEAPTTPGQTAPPAADSAKPPASTPPAATPPAADKPATPAKPKDNDEFF
ncbi:MAG TPA: flagellar motor protein MotB [Dongiaceae bacterium]|nr:flagellar motor protein MotB [Dongiaceae bacterium]